MKRYVIFAYYPSVGAKGLIGSSDCITEAKHEILLTHLSKEAISKSISIMEYINEWGCGAIYDTKHQQIVFDTETDKF